VDAAMRLQKMRAIEQGMTHYMVSGVYLGHRRASVLTATDELPRAAVANLILDARKRIRVDFSRLERKRQKAAKR
jgi:hypothetical protein